MNWFLLALAGLFEIGWPVGLKIAQAPETRWTGVAVAFMAVSGTLLWLAQRTIPIGAAYAVRTGIRAAGAFIVGVMVFGDASSPMRYLGIAPIVADVADLKLGA